MINFTEVKMKDYYMLILTNVKKLKCQKKVTQKAINGNKKSFHVFPDSAH